MNPILRVVVVCLQVLGCLVILGGVWMALATALALIVDGVLLVVFGVAAEVVVMRSREREVS